MNKENANVNTLLNDIINELMGTKEKVMDNSSDIENVQGISSDSASNYCLLRNIDTGFFHHSNSETAVKLKRFYTKLQLFSNSPFERMIEYWEDLMEIRLMVEDKEDINDKRENINITTGEPLKEIQDTSAVSGLRQLLKSKKSDEIKQKWWNQTKVMKSNKSDEIKQKWWKLWWKRYEIFENDGCKGNIIIYVSNTCLMFYVSIFFYSD